MLFHAGPQVEAARSGPVEAAGSLAAAAYLGLEENADEAGAASQSGQVCPPSNAPLLDSFQRDASLQSCILLIVHFVGRLTHSYNGHEAPTEVSAATSAVPKAKFMHAATAARFLHKFQSRGQWLIILSLRRVALM